MTEHFALKNYCNYYTLNQQNITQGVREHRVLFKESEFHRCYYFLFFQWGDKEKSHQRWRNNKTKGKQSYTGSRPTFQPQHNAQIYNHLLLYLLGKTPVQNWTRWGLCLRWLVSCISQWLVTSYPVKRKMKSVDNSGGRAEKQRKTKMYGPRIQKSLELILKTRHSARETQVSAAQSWRFSDTKFAAKPSHIRN